MPQAEPFQSPLTQPVKTRPATDYGWTWPDALPPAPATPMPTAQDFAPTPEETSLFQMGLSNLDIQRKQIQEDLVRQLGQMDEQLKWREGEVQKQVGQIETARPELLGRLGSQFAARGSYRSGARESAQTNLSDELNRQIEGMKTQLAEQQKLAQWQKEEMNLKTQRAYEDLKQKETAAHLEWASKLKSGRATAEKEAKAVTVAQAVGWRNARITELQNYGYSLRDAQARAMHEVRKRHPGLEETLYYSGDMGFVEPEKAPVKPKFEKFDVSPERGLYFQPATVARIQKSVPYQGAVSNVREWWTDPRGRDAGLTFRKYMETIPDKDGKFWASELRKYPQTYSVALAQLLYGRAGQQ